MNEIMVAFDIFDHQNKVTERIELSESVFGAPVNDFFLHQVLKSYQANKRQGTHQVKTRALVSGGGKKPFRQKGTGRARQGTTRAPHHRGGAVWGGPQPRDYRQAINKKMKQEAFRQCLSLKVNRGRFIILNNLDFNEIKTKQAADILKNLDVNGRCLFVDVTPKNTAILSIRNLHKVSLLPVNACSPLDIFESDQLILTKAAAELYQERYAKQGGEA